MHGATQQATEPTHMHTKPIQTLKHIRYNGYLYSTAPIVLSWTGPIELHCSYTHVHTIRPLYVHCTIHKMWTFIIHSVSGWVKEIQRASFYRQRNRSPKIHSAICWAFRLSFCQSMNYGIFDFWNWTFEFHSQQLNRNQWNFLFKQKKRTNEIRI